MTENAKYYSKVCSKIGLAVLLFYAFFTLSTFFVALLYKVFESFMPKFTSEIIHELLLATVYFLSFSAGAFILRRICKDLPSARPIYTSFNINKWVIFGIVAVVAVNFTLAYLNTLMLTTISPSLASAFSSVSNLEGRPTSEVAVLFLLAILSTAVVPAICEEYLFRGAVLANLLPFGKTTAILGSAFLFGIMHQNPLQLLYTTLMGIVIGYVYVKTRSIWICMLLHFANNLITVFEEYLPVLTGLPWITWVIDFIVFVVGAISLLLIIFRKDKEIRPEEAGSFGKLYDKGFDVEEYELDLPQGQKIRHFFSATMIIYMVICIVSIVQKLLSFLGIGITL